MKRLICILLTAGMLLALAACGTVTEQQAGTSGAAGTAPEPDTDADTEPVTEPVTDAPEDNRLELRYDDRYTFPETVTEIGNQKVTSRIAGSDGTDAAVLTLKDDGKTVIATGTGTADVTLAGGTEMTVTVVPAKLSMLFVLGQSNAEGMILGATRPDGDLARSQSILCEEGQVYSTYAPAQNNPNAYGDNIGGVSFGGRELSVANAASFVAASLTGNANAAGETLAYPLNQLTAAGSGKSGLDSGLGFAWNTMSGEKVWVINAAHSGSGIASWQPGTGVSDNNFWQAVGVANACLDTMEREVRAGHYVFSQMGYFWLQGCTDKAMPAAEYTKQYVAMHQGLLGQVARDLDGDGRKEELSFGGILMVRNPLTQLTVLDLRLNGPRTAQFLMGSTAIPGAEKVFLVSVLGDRLTDDLSVENYFKTTYPTGKTVYSTRTAYALPRTAAEVHPDIHYRQPGYNELAVDAVRNLLAMQGGETTDREAGLLKPDGKTLYTDGETVTVRKGEERLIAVLTDPVACAEKTYTVRVTGEGFSYADGTLTVSETAAGEGTLVFSRGDTVILTLKLKPAA